VNAFAKTAPRRFGSFELDLETGRLLRDGRVIRIQPQPFKLLCLLTSRPGALVTREEIQSALWAGDTFVDFEQGVNFAIKQVREALGDRAEDSLYVQTVPKRGYRFLAPISGGGESPHSEAPMPLDPHLQKALWANIAELRLADDERRRQQKALVIAVACLAVAFIAMLLVRL
jgi:DNA-binding winged helix-turn-helix (wHTH) protein